MDGSRDKLQQTQRIRPKNGKDAEILLKSRFVKEELPLPFVLYPNIGGTFICFSTERNGQVFFCSCTEPAIDNYIKLLKQNPKGSYTKPLAMNPLSSHEFPPLIAKTSAGYKENPKRLLQFKKNICHKCNLATPSIRAVNPMYGGKFRQYYGWYIKQKYLQLGIWNNGIYLEDSCPDEIIELLNQGKTAHQAAYEERVKLNEMVCGPSRNDIADDEITYWSNVKIEEAKKYQQLDKDSRKLHRKLSNKIENIVRQEFGFCKIGDGWISESILFKIVQRLNPGKQIIRHHRPDWLNGLELDIYIPEIELAFEYQGQQHFHPVKAWGGSKELKKLKERDKKKKLLCVNRNVHLITVDYTEPLTEKHIKELIQNGK